MTHHVDAIDGLLAAPQTFYSTHLYAERGAFALEWINAFGHVDPTLRTGLTLHGGTLAQLHLGKLQRLSRDIDLLGTSRGSIEQVLNAIADRYDKKLFTWSEDMVERPEVPMRRFSVYFPSALTEGTLVPLKLDITYLPVDLPLVSVRLSASAVYSPTESTDSVDTLTPTAFVADKLPTLGFDTLGYPRPVAMAEDGNPEHIFKQIHDIAGLTDRGLSLDELLPLYAAGVEARNKARRLEYSVAECLEDADRVCRVAIAGWAYPDNDDVVADQNYIIDVQHARAGIPPFAAYSLPGTPDVMVSACRVDMVVRALLAVAKGSLTPAMMRALIERSRASGERARDPNEKEYRTALKAVLGRRTNPEGWRIPVNSRRIFGRAPEAAISAYVGCRPEIEAESLANTGRFTFEPKDVS